MSEIAADEQDLAKALEGVANAASSFDSSSTVTPAPASTNLGGGVSLPPIAPPGAPVTPLASITHGFPSSTDLAAPTPSEEPVVAPVVTPLGSDFSTDSTTSDDSDNSTSNDSTDNTPSDDTSRGSVAASSDNTPTGPLADIKTDALKELRPLVDKLSVSPEEKFDTYLLLIRSTDDTELIAPAHEAAKAIQDEARRAEALLDIIKEIDYLSRQDK